jgi:hypothetical protein
MRQTMKRCYPTVSQREVLFRAIADYADDVALSWAFAVVMAVVVVGWVNR